MQTSPFSDLPSADRGGVDAPPATNAEKLVDDVVGETGAEASTGDARTNGNTSTQSTSGTFDDSQDAAEDLRDGDMASQPSAIPQIATRYPGSVLLTAMALGFLLGRAVSRR
jgi:hypothetical protein